MEVGSISVDNDLKLMLLRHWTLEDSIQNSVYTITKLSLDQDPGMQKYKELLVWIGVPI
jgi:hypothetical protein